MKQRGEALKAFMLGVMGTGKYWVRSADFKTTAVPALATVHTVRNRAESFTVERTEVFFHAFPKPCVMITGSQDYFNL